MNKFIFKKYVAAIFLTLVVMLSLSLFSGCQNIFSKSNKDKESTNTQESANIATEAATATATATPMDDINITFLDVGQGDSSFIEFADGKCMLIDAGVSKSSDLIIDFINNKGYSRIDYLVATHPHADHIGGMKAVVEAFDIGEIYMPAAVTNTKTYENLLTAIADKGMKIKAAKAGMEICSGVNIIAPNSNKYDEMNDYSVVIKITYGEHGFLFMGDAEVLSENEIIAADYDVSADVIKVGHHGSGTSSGEAFVNKTGAKYAIFSVGKDNNYNHPHTFIVERWKAAGAEIFRTDISGNISIVSDGVSLMVTTQK